MAKPTMLEAALHYVAKGRSVFPVHYPKDGKCSCGKPCDSPCKHPMVKHGHNEATRDEALIREWWTRHPGANIGLRGGNGLVYLDVDSHKGGDATLLNYEPILNTPEVRTPKGGAHLYLAEPAVELANAVERLPGLDLRTAKGYVLAPPSRTLDGEYTWVKNAHLNGHFAECPAWLVEAFQERKGDDPAKAPAMLPGKVLEGSRDDLMFKNACRMRYAGMQRDEIAVALLVLNKARCVPELGRDQVLKLADQAAKFPLGSIMPFDFEDEKPGEWPEGVAVGLMGALAGEYLVTGTPTGIRFIDENLTMGGLPDAEVSVFSAYTGTGKTGILLQIADYVASLGIPVCYGSFSDTDATGIRNRLLIMRTGWKGADGPTKSERLYDLWHTEKENLAKLPIHIWDATAGRGGRRIEPFLRWVASVGPGLGIVDYAQKVRSSDPQARTPWQHAEDCCEALVQAANQMKNHFALGSQITRGSKKLGTYDITKGSQGWEEAAAFHLASHIFQEEDLEKVEYTFRDIPGVCEWTIKKNRFNVDGPKMKRTYARWNSARIKFEELS